MKFFPKVEQGSEEWLRLHLGRPTASGFGDLMTTDFEPRKGEMPKTYLYKRLAEKLTGQPLPGFTSRAVEQGLLMEDEAISWFELETGLTTTYMGFVVGDDDRCGCSPDSLVGDDAGIEIKCPNAETHLRYADAGVVPNDYVQQVHGSLFVTGRKEWHFLSYYRGLEPFRIVVKRDEEIMAKIGACLTKFYADFDAAFERLKPKTN
jgi:hypothetical protein